MRFMVVVNNKWMVAVDDESACGAEHLVLDRYADEINKYGVIKGCQAFDKTGMRTNFFFELLEHCETISFDELDAKIDTIESMMETHNTMMENRKATREAIEKIKEQIEALNREKEQAEMVLKRMESESWEFAQRTVEKKKAFGCY